jgi:hypothetical protein
LFTKLIRDTSTYIESKVISWAYVSTLGMVNKPEIKKFNGAVTGTDDV